uniref:Uncharacterized protein n=1 Tax=Nicotiana tabacum TaxID=4097 RepID=A0A1S4C2J0_TOBAC|nr:uncharacterized protein LOC104084707 [Nicotiana tomentosiformis]XP_016495345.1 PREDICTED: uncharacterized protein LOC107814444 [Nicotiana tabacum]
MNTASPREVYPKPTPSTFTFYICLEGSEGSSKLRLREDNSAEIRKRQRVESLSTERTLPQTIDDVLSNDTNLQLKATRQIREWLSIGVTKTAFADFIQFPYYLGPGYCTCHLELLELGFTFSQSLLVYQRKTKHG